MLHQSEREEGSRRCDLNFKIFPRLWVTWRFSASVEEINKSHDPALHHDVTKLSFVLKERPLRPQQKLVFVSWWIIRNCQSPQRSCRICVWHDIVCPPEGADTLIFKLSNRQIYGHFTVTGISVFFFLLIFKIKKVFLDQNKENKNV